MLGCLYTHSPVVWCNITLLTEACVYTDKATEPSNCTDGEMRLSGATTFNQGRLETCMNGAWGSVCDSKGIFTTDEAKVACRQLGKLQVEGIEAYQVQLKD